MNDQEKIANAQAQTNLIIRQVINFWEANNKGITAFFNKHEDDVYLGEVAPGRNRGIYLLAHLIATNDALLPLFNLGEKLFPELAPLASEAESAVPFELSISDLKSKWETLNNTLADHFKSMTAEQWLSRLNSVSDEDFALDPTRNKLNVLMNRSSHENYHRGQLIFLNEKVLAV